MSFKLSIAASHAKLVDTSSARSSRKALDLTHSLHPSPCFGEEVVLHFFGGALDADERQRVHAHIAHCGACRRLVAEASKLCFDIAAQPDDDLPDFVPLRDEDAGAADDVCGAEQESVSQESESIARAAGQREAAVANTPPSIVPAGTHIAHYRLERPIGEGAGSVVYQGFDPQTGRQVAVKVVRPGATSAHRLLAEEKALARISSEHVIRAYDAGVFDGGAFLVTELIEGTTFDEWLDQRPRAWPEILQVMRDAGRGLSAVHQAGLVHRDFKPENIIVGDDGRTRIADLGLAQSVTPPKRSAIPAIQNAHGAETAAAGTPLYMAPEQIRGKGTDARSDLFSFCVTLYIALYRQHPFGADSPTPNDARALIRGILTGVVRPPPRDTHVPVWLNELMTRGLSASPEDRPASMDELLASLTTAHSR